MYLSEIDTKIFHHLLNLINIKFPNKRTPKYSHQYYLERIIFILRSGCSFRDSSNSSIKNHYSSIHKKFLLWRSAGKCRKNLVPANFSDVVCKMDAQ